MAGYDVSRGLNQPSVPASGPLFSVAGSRTFHDVASTVLRTAGTPGCTRVGDVPETQVIDTIPDAIIAKGPTAIVGHLAKMPLAIAQEPIIDLALSTAKIFHKDPEAVISTFLEVVQLLIDASDHEPTAHKKSDLQGMAMLFSTVFLGDIKEKLDTTYTQGFLRMQLAKSGLKTGATEKRDAEKEKIAPSNKWLSRYYSYLALAKFYGGDKKYPKAMDLIRSNVLEYVTGLDNKEGKGQGQQLELAFRTLKTVHQTARK